MDGMSTFDESRVRRGRAGQFAAKNNSAPAVFLPATNATRIASARSEMIESELRDSGVLASDGHFTSPEHWPQVSQRIAQWTAEALDADRAGADGANTEQIGWDAAEAIKQDLHDGRYMDRYGILDATTWEDIGWRVDDAVANAVYEDRETRLWSKEVTR